MWAAAEDITRRRDHVGVGADRQDLGCGHASAEHDQARGEGRDGKGKVGPLTAFASTPD
jgi:hypothetical protein